MFDRKKVLNPYDFSHSGKLGSTLNSILIIVIASEAKQSHGNVSDPHHEIKREIAASLHSSQWHFTLILTSYFVLLKSLQNDFIYCRVGDILIRLPDTEIHLKKSTFDTTARQRRKYDIQKRYKRNLWTLHNYYFLANCSFIICLQSTTAKHRVWTPHLSGDISNTMAHTGLPQKWKEALAGNDVCRKMARWTQSWRNHRGIKKMNREITMSTSTSQIRTTHKEEKQWASQTFRLFSMFVLNCFLKNGLAGFK